jgi:Radical SAM superfamily/4Fe-4S single cluster domain
MSAPLYNAYKLPWKENDNPNGWIEPTTYCQITCPGCYRGIDKKDHNPKHEDLEALKKQIDWFIEKRNVQTISVAGGEPLLYPHIFELIEYINSKRLRTMLYTNGYALDRETLIKLKNSGVTQVLIHLDRYQIRSDIQDSDSLDDIRQKYCNLFREVKGIYLGFIQPISLDYISEIDTINNFANQNIDIVNLIVYALYQEICWNENTKKKIDTSLNMEDIMSHLKSIDSFIPGAYLPSERNSDKPTWVFGIKVGIPNLIFGYFTPRLYRLIQQKYRRKNGRFLFVSRHHNFSSLKLFKFFWIKGIPSILRKYLNAFISKSTKSNKAYYQTTLLLRGPVKDENGWDLCTSCPDRMIYNNKLIPSCILEDLKGSHKISEFQSVI